MNNYDYYTPTSIAEILMTLIPPLDYAYIIDICCGSWNLIEVAHKKHSNAKCIGVDIDISSFKSKPDYAQFYNMDGRCFAKNFVSSSPKPVLILSNPPFGAITKNESLRYELLPFADTSIMKKSRYECEMVAANLMLSKSNMTTYVFILPRTIAHGETYFSFREALANKYQLIALVDLPGDAFSSSEINTCALIIQRTPKGHKKYNINHYRITKDHSTGYTIKREKTITEMSFIGYRFDNNARNKDISVFRGKVSSPDMAKIKLDKTDEIVYHSSSIFKNGTWTPKTMYIPSSIKSNAGKRVKKGDVIINRIGKHAGHWAIVSKDGFISDCILAVSLKDKKKHLSMLNSLSSTFENSKLDIPIHGTTTKFISVKDVVSCIERFI